MVRRSYIFMILVLAAGIFLLFTAGCTDGDETSPTTETETPTPPVTSTPDATETAPIPDSVNYGDPYNWLSLPAIENTVDVFYVYPTVSANASGSMDITDETDRALAQGILNAQASVYEPNANVFAPYYRQMSTGVTMTDSGLATDTEEFKRGAADVEDAFDYYIDHINEGRPFIIAGHSQGTMALIELIKSRFGTDEDLRDRLVAAYLIGYTVTDDDLAKANLTAATGATDTGVVITYNTQSPTSVGGPMLMEGAHCINPLNWKTDDTYASASENLGAKFYNDSTGELLREVANYSDAQINLTSGALMTNIPEGEELDIGSYPEGVYHRYDYAFWYRNLEQNVGDRIQAFLNNNS